MKLSMPQSWFKKSAEIEGNSEVGAGCPAATCSAVTDQDVDAIGEAVGMHHGGWDMVDPKELIAATLKHFKQNVKESHGDPSASPIILKPSPNP